MKKMIWLIFLFFPIFEVRAETYYSDYRISNEVVTTSDTAKVEKVKLYKWYEIGQATKHSLYDGNEGYDCSTKTSNWQTERLETNIGRTEEIRKTYQYQLSKGVRYIHLTDLNGSYGALRITELSIYVDGKPINYSYECNGCHDGFKEHINNGIWDENESYISNGGSLVLDLGEEYPASKVSMTMYLFDLGSANKTYTISFSTTKRDLYINKSYSHTFNDIHWENALRLDYDINAFNTDDWYTYITTSGSVNNDLFVSRKLVKTEYRYKEKWCYYDYEKKNYIDGYYEAAPTSTAKRGTEYISENRYYVRDKIDIADNIILTSVDDKISDFITSTTQYDLAYDFDKTVNGTYNVTIKTPYIIINKEVTVLNKDTIIAELEKEIADLKSKIEKNNQQIAELENTVENKNNTISELEKENESYLQKITELNKQLIVNDEAIAKLEKEITDLKEKLDNNQQKLNELKETIKNNKITISDLKKENKDYNKQIDKLLKENEKLKDSNTIIPELEKENKDYHEKIEKLLQEINKLENNNKTLQDNNKAYREKINELVKANDKLNSDLKLVINHEKELTNYYDNKIVICNNEKDSLNREVNNLTIKLEETNNKNDNIDANVDYLLRIKRQDIADNWYLIVLIILLLILLLIKILKNSRKD